MQSSTSNPYDALVAATPPEPVQDSPPLTALLPLALVVLIVALVATVVWRKREKLRPGPGVRTATGLLIASLTAVWFFWFTGSLNDDEAKAYAIALPLAAIGLRTAWKLARP